ncbi:DNA polymerase I [Steroidobacter agaridevorans]|uniref:DNA polymerase I n=1 Tax=Steroidobacter agaridevorans TaxID=2695856 RepID=A0A829Y4X4_9GAMM|nr:DNA polymerase I [Steroidobacter agaridevorans]GFE78143.1 DNA polymerase I [Steroidobacter agaridevorans]
MATQRKLVLVDGSGYLYRAFHALPPLTNSRDEPTGAVLGVLNMLQKLRKEESPDLIAVVFDAPGRTFRDELFEEYKATRTPMPDELRSQLQPLLDSVRAMGLPLLRIEGVEADDVIGTLACEAAAQNYDVIISTGDKDMAQLVNERITLVNTMTGSRLNRDGVKTKFDVYPEQIIDYLALVGDTSDNIPGIPKVGPKTAAKWLGEYGTLDKLVENAAAITGKVGENLRNGMKELELSRKLATIDLKVKLEQPFETLKVGDPDKDRLRELFTRMEFRALLKQIVGDEGPSASAAAAVTSAEPPAEGAPPPPVPRNYETVVTAAALETWVAQLKSANVMSLNVATTSGGYMQADIVGLAFSVEPGAVAYVPIGHNYPGVPEQLSRDVVLKALKPVLEAEQPLKVGYDLKYKGHVLKRAGIELRGDKFDIMLESYVLNSTAAKHELGPISRRYLGIDPIAYESVAGKGAKQIEFNQVALDTATNYAGEEADLALQLHRLLWPRLEALPPLKELYENIEQPLVPVLLKMEQAGVLLDGDLLRKQSGELATRMREIEAQAYAAAGQQFSLESPKQLQEVLFNKMGLPIIRKTPTGQPSTAEDVLEELAASYELPKLIMDYRAFAKLKSTYTDKLPLEINRSTQRVHTCYQQAIAATGRLSSAEPNLQNIPIRTPEGRRIRQAFVAPKGWCIVAADYSQIELRIMAHLSGDEGLLKAFSEDRDIHLATAAEVFGMTLDTVTADQRRTAKMINFGLIYGMSAFGLASRLGIERSTAARYVETYFQRYPGVRRYMDETRQLAHERGFVETVFGRRLYLNDINARNAALRQAAERAAINAPMQGTAADVIKRAMIQVAHWLSQSKLEARLLLQVHDELVFEVRRELAEDLIAHVRELMSGAAELRVPLKVDAGIGENWDEAH